MEFFFGFFRSLSRNLKLLYTYALLSFTGITALSCIFISLQLYLLILAVILCGIFVVIAPMCIKPFEGTDKHTLAGYTVKRVLYNVFLAFFANLACQWGLSLPIYGIIGSIFYRINPTLSYLISRVILYLFFLFILNKVVAYAGFSDTMHKRFNPHINIISYIFAYVCMTPLACYDFMDFNPSQNPQLLMSLRLSGSPFMFILNFFPIAILSVFLLTMIYFGGRRDFYLKHPKALDYDAVELESYKISCMDKPLNS